MKVFKVRRNGEDYFRVELLRDFTPSGKRRSVVARSRREALEKAQQLLDQQKKGLKIDESRSSLSEFLREFLEFTRAKAALHFGLGKIIGATSSKNIAPGLGVVLIELKPRHVDIWMKSLGDRASALGPSSTPRPPCAGLVNSQLNGRSWTEIRLRRGFAPRSASPRHRTRRSAFNSLIRSMHGNSSRAP